MKNINKVRKYFTGQSDRNDCGLACMCMILNYAGRHTESDRLPSCVPVPDDGFSLLQLRNLAGTLGIDAQCVRMDIETLSKSVKPVILHTVNNKGEGHFVVFFGALRSKGSFPYLIADPARQVHFISAEELETIWPGKAALYLAHITEQPDSLKKHPLFSLLKIRNFRKTLLVTVPLLNVCSTFLGIALSWMLQRGISDPLSDKKTSLTIAIIVLLALITFFKSILSFVRQQILIRLNSSLSEELNKDFIAAVVFRKGLNQNVSRYIRNGFADLQKIQNALSAFVSVLCSEGALITFILGGIWYFVPLAGLVNTVYILLMAYLTRRDLPGLSYDAAMLSELSGFLENELAGDILPEAGDQIKGSSHLKHYTNHAKFLTHAKAVAVKASKLNLFFEWIGTVNVLAILIICLREVIRLELSYDELMAVVILSYFTAALVPKVCNAYSVIIEGAVLVRRYQAIEPKT